MIVRYEITAEDVLAFTRHILARPAFRRSYLFGFLAGPALGLLLVRATGYSSLLGAALKFLFAVVLFSALYMYLYRRQVAANTKNVYAGEGGPLGEKVMTVTPEGVQEVGAHSTVSHAWSGIEAVDETSAAIYLFVSGGSGYLVPKRALVAPSPTPAEFLATIARHRAEGGR
jgi:hypothetical protein